MALSQLLGLLETQHACNVDTQGTCTAQGFCSQLGLAASLTSSLCRALFYLLIIKKNYRNNRLRKVES